MKLNKPDALFLHSLLFHVLTQDLGSDVSTRLRDIMSDMEDFLLTDDAYVEIESDESEDQEVDDDDDTDDADDDDDDDAEEETSEDVKADAFLKPEDAGKLPALTVSSPTGEKVTFEFEDVGEDDLVDVLIDDGSVIIDSVTHLKVTSTSIEVYDGAEWHVFSTKRLPKTWKNITLDTVYGFSVEKGGDEEE